MLYYRVKSLLYELTRAWVGNDNLPALGHHVAVILLQLHDRCLLLPVHEVDAELDVGTVSLELVSTILI